MPNYLEPLQRQEVSARVPHHPPDGKVRHILATGRFRPAPDGTPRRGTGLVQDVTERNRAREEHARLRSLEAASRAQAADLSEMLRVPAAETGIRPSLTRLLSQELPEQIATRLNVEGDDLSISPVIREQIFLVLRETIRNFVSHSGAEEVRVSVGIGGAEIVGIVEDDGHGFEQVATENAPQHGELRYMTERAEQRGGTCSVESVPGKGTRVVASFPLS